MIAKLIRMSLRRRSMLGSSSDKMRLGDLRHAVRGLTSYIVDADPYALAETSQHAILAITDYAFAIEAAGFQAGEKVEAFGSRNLIGDSLESWQAQMFAVAARAPRISSPIIHIILSLREDESWAPTQREEAVDVVLQTLQLQGCQAIWSEHSNTANPHLHLAVVRVDPQTGRPAGTDWLIEDLHHAIALLDERHARMREEREQYVARNGVVFDVASGLMVRDAQGQYIPGWRRAAGRQDARVPDDVQAVRALCIEIGRGAECWSDFHARLAQHQLSYDRSGSGARIAYRQNSVTASSVDRALARSQLEKRWGPYEPDLHRLDAGYEAYRHAFEKNLSALREARNAECQRVEQLAMETLASLPIAERSMLKPLIQLEAESARRALQEAFALSIKQCTKRRMKEQEWIAEGRPTYVAVHAPAVMRQDSHVAAEQSWNPESGLRQREAEWSTSYLDRDDQPIFTDHRLVILFHRIDDAAAIDAALKISYARWGHASLFGPPAFIELATQRAAVLGIPVTTRAAMKELPRVPAPPSSSQAIGAPKETSQERRDRILKTLREHPALPLRRRRRRGDTEATGNTGRFEIVKRPDAITPGQANVIFDRDPQFQQICEDHRQRLLEFVRERLLEVGVGRCPVRPQDVLPLVTDDPIIRRPVELALGDRDFAEMLRTTRTLLMVRDNQANSRHPTVRADLVEFQTAQEEFDPEVTLALLKRRDRGRG